MIFRAVHDNFLPTDSYLALVFKIPFPELPDMPKPESIDSSICSHKKNVPLWQLRQAQFMNNLREKDYLEERLKNFYTPPDMPPPYDKQDSLRYEYKVVADVLDQRNKKVIERSNSALTRSLHHKRRKNCEIILRALNATLSKYDAARNDVFFSYQGLLQIIDEKLIRTSNRTKRAWIDISPIAETVFGLAQAKHVCSLQRSVEHLFTNQNKLANDSSDLFQQLAAFANITTRRIDTV